MAVLVFPATAARAGFVAADTGNLVPVTRIIVGIADCCLDGDFLILPGSCRHGFFQCPPFGFCPFCHCPLFCLDFFTGADLDEEQDFCRIVTDHPQHLVEQFEGFKLVFLFWILMGIATQMDPFAQVLQ